MASNGPKLPKVARSTRVSRIAQWLRSSMRPPQIRSLVLEVLDGDDAPCRLQTWERTKDFDCDLVASEIDDTIQGMADEAGARVHGFARWLLESGEPWTSLPLRVEPTEGHSQQFEGSTKSLLVQQQRHIEAMSLQYFKAIQATLDTHSSVMTSLATLVETREGRSAQLEVELARVRDENADLQSQLAQATVVAEQSVEQAESAAEELANRQQTSGSDQQMMALISQAATKVLGS